MIYSCPLCGKQFRAEGEGAYRCPSCDGEIMVRFGEGTAWDVESRGRWVDAFIAVVKGAIADPINFFSRVSSGRGWLRPWVFALIVSSIVFLISAAYQMGFQALAAGAEIGGSLGDPLGALAFLSAYPLSAWALIAFAVIGVPVGTTAGLLMQAGLYHLCLMLLGSARREFTATFRVACYSMTPQLFQILPLIGGPIAWMWQTALAIIGVKVVHRTSYGRSALAVFLPMILCCGVFVLIGLAVGGWLFAALISKAA